MARTLLAGDIGGTKTILRLVKTELPQLQIQYEKTYGSQNFSDLVPMVHQFLEEAKKHLSLSKINPQSACFGIAGPVINNTSKVTNLSWPLLTKERLIQELSIPEVNLINDFAAIGYGILGLASEDLYTLQNAQSNPKAPIAVLGAGTGLGECFLIPGEEGNYMVFSTEGAHGDFAPRTELEFELLNYIKAQKNLDRVSIERVVSGQGIVSIYQFLREKNPQQESQKLAKIYQTWKQEQSLDLAAEISKAALAEQDLLCLETLKIFLEAYGAEVGNLALKLLPYGGLYLAGGIAAKILPLLEKGDFLKAFKAKGRMSSLLEQIPIYVSLNPKVGLIGATLYAARK